MRVPERYLIALLFIPAPGLAQGQPFKIQASDLAAGDFFGAYSSISSSTIVIGATFHDHGAIGTKRGSSYVFERAGNSWTQVNELLASDGDSDDGFGRAAIWGDTTVVTATGDEGILLSGSAYIFQKSKNAWVERYRLIPIDVGENHFASFGTSVALRRSLAALGAPDDGPHSNGSVYLFHKQYGQWQQLARIVPDQLHDGAHLGTSLSVNGDVIVAGAPHWSGCVFGAGEAYTIENVNGSWTVTQKLCHSFPEFADWFGWSVSVSGDRIAVGAPHEDDGGGAVYVFERGITGWELEHRLSIAELQPQFGYSTVLSGNLLLVTGTYGDGVRADTGAAWIFERRSNGWFMKEKVFAPDGETSDYFGYQAAMFGGLAVVTAPNDSSGSVLYHGSAYVFQVGIGTRYCQSAPNSHDVAAQIVATGSPSVASNDLRLTAAPVPLRQVGIFACGSQHQDLPFGDGRLCIGGSVLRFALGRPRGEVLFGDVDNTVPPFVGQVNPGSTWYFQAWFRDPESGGTGFNTSDALVITFEP